MFRLRTRAGTGSALALLAVLTLTSAVQAEASAITLTNRAPEPGAATAPAPGAPSAVERLDIEASIRKIYARFTEVTRISGNEVGFVISDVVTYRPNQFAKVRWVDVSPAEPGPTIQTAEITRVARLPSLEKVSFESKWVEAPPEAGADFEAFRRAAAGMTLVDGFALSSEKQPERYSGVEALSVFTVTVTLEERSRTYRANVAWKTVGTDLVLFSLGDVVINVFTALFDEDRKVVPLSEIRDYSHLRSDSNPLGANSRFSCQTKRRLTTLPTASLSTRERHRTGFHSAKLTLPVECIANAGCDSHCLPLTPLTTCADTGELSERRFSHVMRFRHADDSVSGLGAGMPSQCGYALGCAVVECVIGDQCLDVQFAIGGGGAQIAARATSEVFTELSTQRGATCPAAIPIDDRDGPPCEEETPGMVALDLHGQGEPISLGTGAVKLRRLEPSTTMHHGHAVSYLMGEWALISVPGASGGGAAGAEVQGATVEDFGAAVVAGLSDTLSARLTASGSGKREALVVAVPLHEPNSRRIPLPALSLEDQPVRVPEAHRGRALLLADFGEDYSLQKLHVLHSTAFVPRELALHLERSLKLTPQTAEPHRVVAFVLVDVGAKLEIVSQLMYLPRCCCGDYFCQ